MSLRSTALARTTFSSPHTAATAGFEALSGVQSLRPHQQLLGLATAFWGICEALHISPTLLLSVVDRMAADCRYRDENTIDAITEYALGELEKHL